MSTKTLVQKLSKPYAEALLETAKKSEKIGDIAEDVRTILQVLDESSKLTDFLDNPLISSTSKKAAIDTLFKEQLNNELLVFIFLLIDRKRIFYLSSILNRYLQLVYALESFVIADVCTSITLTDQQQQDLIDKLKIMTGKSNIQLNLSLDKNLIAGFTVQIGSKIIDTSLRGQLREISYFLGASNI
uniref:ATP synthase subunit delta, chloroplastic n=1 Tax=Helminthora furcellata TaxID=1884666 RepID=A0A1G4NZE3_9FLOR|nr:ATP synthase CF1 subunit delta [Helminthora furcellata]SCW21134.1 ATP synthase CF1 subunit delta [Helminthora furcellata]SCW23994.1 ATP synthase CF1 subunit delta [Helminthora furcellata]